MPNKTPLRVNVYIDGFNFYYGLKQKGWKKYYWLDIVKFFECFMKDNQVLNKVYYCTAVPTNKGQKTRQRDFFKANKQNPKFELVFGKFLEKKVKFGGKEYTTFEEKQTDVNIAINLIRNIHNNSCDTSIIVSADSDLVPVIELAKEINPNHKILFHFPPERNSVNLTSKCDAVYHLHRYEARFKKCLLASEIKINESLTVKCPSTWQ